METKNNTGAIFKNDKKTSEAHPDYKGKVNVNGKDMEVALWLRKANQVRSILVLHFKSLT